MLELFMKRAEEEINDTFVELLEDSDKVLLLPQGDWPEIFDNYIEKVKAKLIKQYVHDSQEEEKAWVVHMQIIWRLEWVMMKHPTYTILHYPLLMKSVLPKIADHWQLQQVQWSIVEVSIFIWLMWAQMHAYDDVTLGWAQHAPACSDVQCSWYATLICPCTSTCRSAVVQKCHGHVLRL